MRSQLTDANISNINGGNWVAEYSYHDNGDMAYRTIQSDNQTFSYTGHQMTDADGNSLSWDENGNMKKLPDDSVTTELIYNWDNKLRHGQYDTKTVDLKYDPSGNRIYKNSSEAGQRKYIVDIVGDLPVILLELDSSNNIKKTYIYANSQIIAQHDGDHTASRYFYLHDRLGSVRELINTSGAVENMYTYKPFGKLFATEATENITNPFKFTGQYFDSEIDEYYLRARQYDPVIGRFTSRDPVFGKKQKPLTLHKYLYCLNDPINRIDPDGRLAFLFGGSFSGGVSAMDFSSGFIKRRGLGGLGGIVAHYSVLLPAMTMLTENFGVGGTFGAGFVAAWDHTKGFKGLTDSSAWSWGTMQWAAGGASAGGGGSITLDIGASNARHVSKLSGRFVEGGGSVNTGLFGGLVVGGTLSRGVNPDGSWNDIWLGTASFGGGTPGGEVHGYVGRALVQEYEF